MCLQKHLSDQQPADHASRLNRPVIADLGREAPEKAGLRSRGRLVNGGSESETQHFVWVTVGDREREHAPHGLVNKDAPLHSQRLELLNRLIGPHLHREYPIWWKGLPDRWLWQGHRPPASLLHCSHWCGPNVRRHEPPVKKAD